MREIKFRAWDFQHGKMRSVAFIEWDAASALCNVALRAEGLKTRNGYRDRFEERKDAEDLVLLQFTGLRDSEGTEIYEKDIVEFGPPGRRSRAVVVMEEDDPAGGFTLDCVDGDPDTFTGIVNLYHYDQMTAKVIGDALNSPELLK